MLKIIFSIFLICIISTPSVFAANSTKDNLSLGNIFSKIDSFRKGTYRNITDIRKDTQKEIDKLSVKKQSKSSNTSKPLDGTELPIAYIKLFLLSITSFMFSAAFVFYTVFLLFVFIILKYLYRRIKHH